MSAGLDGAAARRITSGLIVRSGLIGSTHVADHLADRVVRAVVRASRRNRLDVADDALSRALPSWTRPRQVVDMAADVVAVVNAMGE